MKTFLDRPIPFMTHTIIYEKEDNTIYFYPLEHKALEPETLKQLWDVTSLLLKYIFRRSFGFGLPLKFYLRRLLDSV